MDVIWGSGGTSIFDYYSLHHIAWFVALTTILVAIFRDKAWLSVLAIIIMWEVFEEWACENLPNFPFIGKEMWYNKIIGDTICDFVGFGIAIIAIKSIRKWKYEERQTTGVETKEGNQ